MEEIKKAEVANEGLDNSKEESQQSTFSFANIMKVFILNWQWFLLSMFIFICGALIYLRYADRMYSASVKMLIKEEQNNRRSSGQMLANMQDFGFMSTSTGIENEVEILQSHIIALEAVKDLKLYVEYRTNGRIIKSLMYKTNPFCVDLEPDSLELLDRSVPNSFSFKVTRTASKYEVESTNSKKPFRGSFVNMPATLSTPYGMLTFTTNMEGEELTMETDEVINVKITSPMVVANRYANALNVAPTSKMTSIAELSISDESVERAFDYLNQVAIVYNRQANADKNEIAYKTEEFINSRLEKINAELGMTESELEEYKRSNNLTELRLDANQTLSQSSLYAAQLAEANTQIMLLDYLREHVNDPANQYQIIPSNVGMTDPTSSSLITQYNNNVQERNRLMRSASENAPQVLTITNNLDNLMASIKAALQQAKRTAEIHRQSVENQYRTYSQRINNTPEQERILTQIGRQQEVKSGLYLMLLQKREENSISLAATADKGKLIDMPLLKGQVSPKSSIILMMALILGFGFPLLIIFGLELLRYKIEGHEDVARLTKLPIVADVAVANEAVKSSAGIVVQENQNNQIDEIFRSMRTNIQFMMNDEQKVILFTSTTSGEGKTFNAANIAMSFALLGKKVILCGLDIRKPALGRLFSINDRQSGITPLLLMSKVTEADVKSQIKPSGVNANLSLLLAGPTPPNPAELLARSNMSDIIEILKANYDYIILDTAPVGLVTDTLQIAKYADVTAFVCRADYTPKNSFALVNQLSEENKMPNMCIVLNGVDMSKKKYGYYYGYGKYGRYGRYGYGNYGRYGYGNYGNYGNYGVYAQSHYGNKDDNSIKR
ncbi:MAG: polysaccharide biosynthesis tyrosine autokinase [Prevotella sp.]|nr:polysaccharide biosynthesis tyrosine autokinase [Prevotella sp.]